MASGATVKPSLLFFRKFTEEEANSYADITAKAKGTVAEKYKKETDLLETQLKLRGKDALSKEKKIECRTKLKTIREKIATEVKMLVKEEFDYEIPIAEVQKAGISTTGAEIENELVPLLEEFTPYRKEVNLWDIPIKGIKYRIDDEGNMFRYRDASDIISAEEEF